MRWALAFSAIACSWVGLAVASYAGAARWIPSDRALSFLAIVFGLPVLLVLVIAIGARLRGSTAIVLCVAELCASGLVLLAWLALLGASGALS